MLLTHFNMHVGIAVLLGVVGLVAVAAVGVLNGQQTGETLQTVSCLCHLQSFLPISKYSNSLLQLSDTTNGASLSAIASRIASTL